MEDYRLLLADMSRAYAVLEKEKDLWQETARKATVERDEAQYAIMRVEAALDDPDHVGSTQHLELAIRRALRH